jgi:uroporphyrinogen decarboxylase
LNDRFLRACRGEAVDRTPIWIMRQAGRYLPEYRELRKGRTMLETVSTPDLAAEATLQPIRRFGFDAAILFSDLTVPFTPMGAPFDIKEGVGPVVHDPVRTPADLDRLRLFEPEEGLPFVLETIRILKGELDVPLIGFTGAPFTLASYLIEGGPSKDHKRTRALMYAEPAFWHRLMELLSEVVRRYLSAQIRAGADAVQLFDSWIGVIDEAAYREFLLPHMRSIFDGLRPLGAPVIHFGTGTAALLPVMQEAGGDVLGVDWRISLTRAAASMRPTPLQGNLDPALLLVGGEPMLRRGGAILEEGRELPGHIFNLGHGIYPETPIENVEALVELVKSSSPPPQSGSSLRRGIGGWR